MKSIIHLLVFSIFLFLHTLSSHAYNEWTTKMDSWYNEPTQNDLAPWDWEEVKYFELKAALQNDAQAQLSKEKIIKLTKSQIKQFLGQETKIDNKFKYFLVRAVYLNEYTGEFSVYKKNTMLWVYHNSLGQEPVPMERKALIVLLKQKPEIIYITCMMDQ